jgi:hypothetical protein
MSAQFALDVFSARLDGKIASDSDVLIQKFKRAITGELGEVLKACLNGIPTDLSASSGVQGSDVRAV